MKRLTHLLRARLRSGRGRCCLSAAVLFFAVAAESRAEDRFWGNLLGGTFSDPINWQGGFVPGAGDAARFGLTANPLFQRIYTVSFTADATNQSLHIEDDFVEFDLNLRTYTTTLSAGNEIGTVAGRSGRLTITDGIMSVPLGSDLAIGAVAGGFGTLTVSTGGVVVGDPILLVGRFGAGTLTVQNNALVLADETSIGTNAGATGTATITGAGSRLVTGHLSVGNEGAGTLNIAASGRVDSGESFVGLFGASTGIVNLDGTDSQWRISGDVTVGHVGEGTLNITDGGWAQSTNGFVGFFAVGTGIVSVDGPNSQWINSSDLVSGDAGSGTVSITNGGRVQNIDGFVGRLAVSTGTVNVDGLNSQWISLGDLTLGIFGSGTANITNGGRVQNINGFVGNETSGTGEVNVGGFQAVWFNLGALNVGNRGTGTVRIEAGGLVQNVDGFVGNEAIGTGHVIVDGEGSVWNSNNSIRIGVEGRGTLMIEAGGSVSDRFGSIGDMPDSNGMATVTGAGSSWTNSSVLTVGNSGTGTLAIELGGSVTSPQGDIGFNSGSSGTVTVSGLNSQWINSNRLRVGRDASGMLNITDGGLVRNFEGVVGDAFCELPDGFGRVTVSDAQWINEGNLIVGNGGQGTLDITAGGTVQNTDGFLGISDLNVTFCPVQRGTGTATVRGAGATWTMTGRLSIGGEIGIDVGERGTLNIQPGGTVSVEKNTLLFVDGLLRLEGGALATSAIGFLGGVFQWTSGTLHVGIFDGNLINPSGGTLAPGRSAGSTFIVGNYREQAGAKLEIEIGGLLGGVTHDLVDVTGGAFLGGELQVAMLDDFVPSAGNTFTVLKAAGGISGVFANVANGRRLTTVDGIGSFLVHYGPGSAFTQSHIVLTDFRFTPGDCDHDGRVDLDDFIPFPDCLSGPGVPFSPTECECIDLNADNDVDLSDFAAFQAASTGP